MRRIVLFAAAVFLASVLGAGGAWAFGWKDVVQMHRDGIADSLIIQKIKHSGKEFHLGAADVRGLKQAGVSDAVVSAMLRTEGRGHVAYGPYYYPRDPYYGYYAYDHPYYPRVVVGLGFGYYGHHRPWPYYGSYRGVGPRVYHGRPVYGGRRHFR